MKPVRVKIDGREVLVTEGTTILQAAEKAGVPIPTLCFHKRLEPAGICGICAVEVEGNPEPVLACNTSVSEGMSIVTSSDKLTAMRREILKNLLAHHPMDCPICDKAGECELQDLVYKYNVTGVGTPKPISKFTETYTTTFIRAWPERCISCLRCVRACSELQGNYALSVVDGPEGVLISYDPSKCVSCGECIQICPTGALTEKKAWERWRIWQIERKVRTTCPYCGVGCQLLLHVRKGKIVKVTGVEDAEPNRGRLCVKGRYGFDFIYSEERLKTPLIRTSAGFREASWNEALDLIARRFKEIIKLHGPDAIAGVSCARSINEDSYNMQKFFRAVIGTNNIDHCART
ncbi:4Fe-4S dicluster domain-containing protein [Thermodesulforhabdus norvegica]|uniref:4Fe-4S dicluster domain-containing protein n=3 Tax=Thermodesulforhabdus norvegica TaxID=39841 RepID=A0A1I4S3T3_9BACT|nr:4Fe-4S dicluster domain-containing protein [Thermodesulforhabdus norvegica]